MPLVLRGVLRGFGANGIIAESDGQEAFEIVKNGGVDLVICDTLLKTLSGFELCKAIRALDDPDIQFLPLVILTSHTQFGNVLAARDCGSSTVLAKPLVPQRLFDRLLWLTHDKRQMIVAPNYVGPNRRYHDITPPGGERMRYDDA